MKILDVSLILQIWFANEEDSWILEGGAKKKKSNESDSSEKVNNVTDVSTPAAMDVSKQAVEFPSLGNYSPGVSNSYANATGKPSRKSMNFRTLYTLGGNGVDVVVPFSSMGGLNAILENGPWFVHNNPLILKKWNLDVNLLKEDVENIPVWVKLHGVPVTAFSEDGLSVIATKLGTPLMLDSYTFDMCLHSWGRSSYAKAMIELRANVELKDTILMAMPKLTREGFYTCTVHVEYEWKPLRCLGVAKNLKKPSEAPRGIPVVPKVGFKPAKEYRHVSKKPTANTSSNKKKHVEPTKEVSNSNPFDVLNLVENDGELGTNGGTSNLASNGANSSGSSFWNVEINSTSTTPIVDKTGKLEKLIIDGKVTLVDDDERVGFGTKSLLEQWRDTYENGDYDEDPYDNDMYEGQDFPDKIQDICDNLNIRV
ncbi:retrotransposon protein, putative, ty1-copia subclass [Tanacetum coccineum]|uniref:Retrotransposon protein, putative, ty1-copia subclass n=1 Tax=Tanacetum coccineum TaxID=301880 RepID=A0ABQ5B802_9ASTR